MTKDGIPSDELDAAVAIVRSLLVQLGGAPIAADDTPIHRFGIDSSGESGILLTWRLSDAFFAELSPDELSSGMSVLDIARLMSRRQSSNARSESPVRLFVSIRRGLGSGQGAGTEAVDWGANPRETQRVMRRGPLTLSGLDCGFDDLLQAIDDDLGPAHGFWDSMCHKNVNIELCELFGSVGALVNYLWRLRQAKGRRPIPRFGIGGARPSDHDARADWARRDLARLVAVMGLTNETTMRESENLHGVFTGCGGSNASVAAGGTSVGRRWRSLLGFEVRCSLGAEPGPWRKWIYGDLRYDLPRGIETFGDLAAYLLSKTKGESKIRPT